MLMQHLGYVMYVNYIQRVAKNKYFLIFRSMEQLLIEQHVSWKRELPYIFFLLALPASFTKHQQEASKGSSLLLSLLLANFDKACMILLIARASSCLVVRVKVSCGSIFCSDPLEINKVLFYYLLINVIYYPIHILITTQDLYQIDLNTIY